MARRVQARCLCNHNVFVVFYFTFSFGLLFFFGSLRERQKLILRALHLLALTGGARRRFQKKSEPRGARRGVRTRLARPVQAEEVSLLIPSEEVNSAIQRRRRGDWGELDFIPYDGSHKPARCSESY